MLTFILVYLGLGLAAVLLMALDSVPDPHEEKQK